MTRASLFESIVYRQHSDLALQMAQRRATTSAGGRFSMAEMKRFFDNADADRNGNLVE